MEKQLNIEKRKKKKRERKKQGKKERNKERINTTSNTQQEAKHEHPRFRMNRLAIPSRLHCSLFMIQSDMS